MRLSEYNDDELKGILPQAKTVEVNTHGDGPAATATGNTITYNGRTHTARTANGVEIVDGLRVFTNNLDRGTVDLSRANWEWHGPEGVYHFWFDVKCDTNYKGEPSSDRVMQSDDRVATRFNGKAA